MFINSLTDVTLTFKFQHNAIAESASINYPARIEIEFTDTDFKIDYSFLRVLDTNITGQVVTVETVDSNGKVTLNILSPSILANTVYSVTLSPFKMAGSKQKMGPVSFQLSKQWFNGFAYVYYPIDKFTENTPML